MASPHSKSAHALSSASFQDKYSSVSGVATPEYKAGRTFSLYINTKERQPRYKSMNTPLSRSGKLLPSDHGSLGTVNEVAFSNLVFADALWEYVAVDPEELSFEVGDMIEVTDTEDNEWWGGSANGYTGWFPANYVRLRAVQGYGDDRRPSSINRLHMTATRSLAVMPGSAPTAPLPTSPSFTPARSSVRGKVIEEILSSERCYVGHLRDIVEGYLAEAQMKKDLFDVESIDLVFGNVQEILAFQSDLLEKMEECVNTEDPASSIIGPLFVERESLFQVYSHYCNNHPHAVRKLDSLQGDRSYTLFFEACRLLRQMANLSLGSFLLTPVQKICKYPLQIRELLKHTDPTHRDHEHVLQAHVCMSKVAETINERKRRTECVEKIVTWQLKVIDWIGDNITALSSILIHSGELVKLSKGRAQPRMFFLFDHQLVWCKHEGKDGHRLFYRGRLMTSDCHIEKVDDSNKDGIEKAPSPMGVTYSLSLFNSLKSKWYILRAASEQARNRWYDAFLSERELIKKDNSGDGVADSERWRKSAPLECRRRKSSAVGLIRSITPTTVDMKDPLATPYVRSACIASGDKRPACLTRSHPAKIQSPSLSG